ncbi:helicase-like protein [Paenibacillus taihuensis]|uniref:Helicase-like protein n=1 Tax=Paenibacillus taihuensis TaxID=1156355 RepID=A0A3D9SNE9_9BACL|nr:DEAD/DEAH box helicase [Paenibacillus taihuensis]REE90609.1 helicase-like protein [Paenibacillus taihuensis]
MKNMISDLVKSINHFNGSDNSFEILRNIICDISDNKSLLNEPLVKELLYLAAQKMRTFGYNTMNHLDISIFQNVLQDNYSESTDEEIERHHNLSLILQNEAINSLYTSSSGNLLDKDQKNIIEVFNERPRLLVSAPTSFGKTYILREIIYQNYEHFRNIILIFPTVSLLNENVHEFKKFNRDLGLEYSIINTTQKKFDPDSRNLFIFTPERVLQLLNENPNFKIDFFFMDEVYKIDNFFDSTDSSEGSSKEEERDKVFRIVLYILSKKATQFYLAGPYINTTKLGEGFQRFIKLFDIRIIEIGVERVKKDHIHSWGTRATIGRKQIIFKDNKKISKLNEIISFLEKSDEGKSIIYAESKKKVSTLAREIVSVTNTIEPHYKLNMFIEHLIKRYSYTHRNQQIHKSWTLIETLNKGIGLHHGAFPKYIQSEILSLFNNGPLNILICTTSITEGVNTKAKNVVFYGSSKGGKELKCFDIKNINGRAGRYYHHFIGRIFYLDKKIHEKVQQNDDTLDFITFSNREVTDIDLDNVAINDLWGDNKARKADRELVILESGVDNNVLNKNKLIDKLKQIELVNLLKNKNILELKSIVTQCSSLKNFLENKTIYKILGYFEEVGLLTEFDVKKFGIITSNYSNSDGMYRLIKYHLDSLDEINAKSIDSIYTTVFSDIRNIVEYKVPKYLTIFGTLLEYVCSLPEINIGTEKIAIDFIIRFFEIGVQTELGTELAEIGFPITTIKMLEKEERDLMKYSFDAVKSNYHLLKHQFQQSLDSYEVYLLENIIAEG